jgi:plasmid maintenance system antidote protein VapI
MIKLLIKIQIKLGFTDTEMATTLNVSRAWWNFLKNGKQHITDKVARKAYNAFKNDARLPKEIREKLQNIFLTNNHT